MIIGHALPVIGNLHAMYTCAHLEVNNSIAAVWLGDRLARRTSILMASQTSLDSLQACRAPFLCTA